MGKLRKNHVKRIYKKTYDKSPSVETVLKTVLTTSFKYALRYGYVEEDLSLIHISEPTRP